MPWSKFGVDKNYGMFDKVKKYIYKIIHLNNYYYFFFSVVGY